MRKFWMLFLALGLITACNNKGKDKPADKTGAKDTVAKDNKDSKDDNAPRDEQKDNTTTVTGWPQNERDDFMNNCVPAAEKNGVTNDVATRYCQCMLDKIEAKYPDVNQAARLTDEELQDVMKQYRDGCLPRE